MARDQILLFVPLLLMMMVLKSVGTAAQAPVPGQFRSPRAPPFRYQTQATNRFQQSMAPPAMPDSPAADWMTTDPQSQPQPQSQPLPDGPTNTDSSILPNLGAYQSQLDAANARNMDLINQEIQMASNNYRQAASNADQRLIQADSQQFPQLVAEAIQSPTAFPAAPAAVANQAQVSPGYISQIQQRQLQSAPVTLSPYSPDPQSEIEARARRVFQDTQRLPLPQQPPNQPTIESLIQQQTGTRPTAIAPQEMPAQPLGQTSPVQMRIPLQQSFGLTPLQRETAAQGRNL